MYRNWITHTRTHSCIHPFGFTNTEPFIMVNSFIFGVLIVSLPIEWTNFKCKNNNFFLFMFHCFVFRSRLCSVFVTIDLCWKHWWQYVRVPCYSYLWYLCGSLHRGRCVNANGKSINCPIDFSFIFNPFSIYRYLVHFTSFVFRA